MLGLLPDAFIRFCLCDAFRNAQIDHRVLYNRRGLAYFHLIPPFHSAVPARTHAAVPKVKLEAAHVAARLQYTKYCTHLLTTAAQGEQLEDNRTLAGYSIQNESTVTLRVASRVVTGGAMQTDLL